MRQAGLFGLSDQLKRLSDCGDPLETMGRVVDFEVFRPALEKALAYGDGAKGGRPSYDPVAMFKVLILAAQNTVSDARMEFLIRERLSWLRFLGFDLGAVTPDENTIRLFREKLTRAGAIDALFSAFDQHLRERGYLPMGGQIVDATLVAAPKQRNTAAEKDAIKAGKSAAEIWPGQPAKAAQKDTDARWTLKFAKGRALPGGKPGIDIAIPSFGYKSSIAICRRHGFIRRGKVTDGARFDGRMLRDVVTNDNTASDVWAKPAKVPAMRSIVGKQAEGDTPTAADPTRRGSSRSGASAASIARSPRASRCRLAPPAPTPPSPPYVPASSTCSPGRRTRWRCSSARSASRAPRRRSRSPTSPTTSTAWSSTNDGPPWDNRARRRCFAIMTSRNHRLQASRGANHALVTPLRHQAKR